MRKILLSTLAFIFGAVMLCNAQDENYEGIVYLKNRSIIRGVITEQVAGESLTIKTAEGKILVYNTDEFWRVRKRPSRESVINNRTNSKSGYMGIIEAGYGFGVGSEYDLNRFTINIINGYRFVTRGGTAIGMGIGFGVQSYEALRSSDNDLTLPVFAHFRCDILPTGVSPFFSFNIGYNVNLSEEIFYGLILEPAIGTGFRISPKNRLNFSVGFAMNSLSKAGMRRAWGRSSMGKAVNLKLGITF